jgi:hypothetical protein
MEYKVRHSSNWHSLRFSLAADCLLWWNWQWITFLKQFSSFLLCYILLIKVILSFNKAWRIRGRDGMLDFHPYLDIWYNQASRVVNSFLLETELTPRLVNADRRNRSLENFQGPYWQLKLEPSVLWRSASTNSTTARPCTHTHMQMHALRRGLGGGELCHTLLYVQNSISEIHIILSRKCDNPSSYHCLCTGNWSSHFAATQILQIRKHSSSLS